MTVGFIETELFTASAAFLSDDELRAAQAEIAANPTAGDVVKGRRALGNSV